MTSHDPTKDNELGLNVNTLLVSVMKEYAGEYEYYTVKPSGSKAGGSKYVPVELTFKV